MYTKKKLIYILPEYNNDLDWHIYYLANFLEQIGTELDIALIVEKSQEKTVGIKNMQSIYIQKFSNPVLRFLEILCVTFSRRLSGYKTVYIHYSYIWAIASSIVMRLSFGRTYYWSCWMMWLFWEQPLLKLTLKFVNFLVTGVNALKDWYSQHYDIRKDKILIMPNWIELERIKSVQVNKIDEKEKLWMNKDDKIILFVHRLAERKWIHYVIPIANFFEGEENIKFLIIGDGPYKKQLLEGIKDWNIKNIHYIGKVPNREVYKYFLISDVFLMPSEEEWFPRVLLESMACGVPYVASDIGGVREISPEWQQEYIYKIGDAEWFVQWINKQLWVNKKSYNKHIEGYDIKNITPVFIKIISN